MYKNEKKTIQRQIFEFWKIKKKNKDNNIVIEENYTILIRKCDVCKKKNREREIS